MPLQMPNKNAGQMFWNCWYFENVECFVKRDFFKENSKQANLKSSILGWLTGWLNWCSVYWVLQSLMICLICSAVFLTQSEVQIFFQGWYAKFLVRINLNTSIRKKSGKLKQKVNLKTMHFSPDLFRRRKAGLFFWVVGAIVVRKWIYCAMHTCATSKTSKNQFAAKILCK
jgi:hypothetical protein